jgi:hypothetical protein
MCSKLHHLALAVKASLISVDTFMLSISSLVLSLEACYKRCVQLSVFVQWVSHHVSNKKSLLFKKNVVCVCKIFGYVPVSDSSCSVA